MIADFSSSQMISWQTFWAEEKKRKEKRVWRQFLPFHSSVCCVTGRVLVNWLCGTISLFFSFSCFFFSFPRKIFPKKKTTKTRNKEKKKERKKSPIADDIVVKSPPWQTQVERITYGGWEQKGVVELEEQEGRTYSVIWRKQGEREKKKKKKKKKAEKGMSGKEMNQKARRHQSNGTESARAYYNDPPFKSAAGETSFHQQVNKVNTE